MKETRCGSRNGRPGSNISTNRTNSIGNCSRTTWKNSVPCNSCSMLPTATRYCSSSRLWMPREKTWSFAASMSVINPQVCHVFSFKHPSATELDHDFLWRTTMCLPERGRIGVFNRSYYEEVLIVRVHPEILRNQGIPPK